MNSNGIIILYKNSFVILHFFSVFNIVMFLYRNDICFLMIICTIVASISFGIYSTFTLFENIWLVLMLCVLKYTYKTKKNYSTLDYSFNSFERFEADADGVLRCTVYKKKYRWFLVLGCIAFALNALSAWIVDDSSMPLLVTILELGTLALNIFTVYKVTDFFAGYGPIRFTGINEAGTAKVVLIFDTIMNKLYTEEDYLKTFPFMPIPDRK